jgi:hypothetical protein
MKQIRFVLLMKAIPKPRDIPNRSFAFQGTIKKFGSPGPGSSSYVAPLYHSRVNMYSRIESPFFRDILTANGIDFINKRLNPHFD